MYVCVCMYEHARYTQTAGKAAVLKAMHAYIHTCIHTYKHTGAIPLTLGLHHGGLRTTEIDTLGFLNSGIYEELLPNSTNLSGISATLRGRGEGVKHDVLSLIGILSSDTVCLCMYVCIVCIYTCVDMCTHTVSECICKYIHRHTVS
jgi:hypothetical protein